VTDRVERIRAVVANPPDADVDELLPALLEAGVDVDPIGDRDLVERVVAAVRDGKPVTLPEGSTAENLSDTSDNECDTPDGDGPGDGTDRESTTTDTDNERSFDVLPQLRPNYVPSSRGVPHWCSPPGRAPSGHFAGDYVSDMLGVRSTALKEPIMNFREALRRVSRNPFAVLLSAFVSVPVWVAKVSTFYGPFADAADVRALANVRRQQQHLGRCRRCQRRQLVLAP